MNLSNPREESSGFTPLPNEEGTETLLVLDPGVYAISVHTASQGRGNGNSASTRAAEDFVVWFTPLPNEEGTETKWQCSTPNLGHYGSHRFPMKRELKLILNSGLSGERLTMVHTASRGRGNGNPEHETRETSTTYGFTPLPNEEGTETRRGKIRFRKTSTDAADVANVSQEKPTKRATNYPTRWQPR